LIIFTLDSSNYHAFTVLNSRKSAVEEGCVEVEGVFL